MGILPDSGRAAERLDHEVMGWLTTVTANGRPQSSGVWFVSLDDAIYIQSQREAAKLRNIRANGKVSFHLDGDGAGGDIVKGKPVDARFDLSVPRDTANTRPYFSRPDIEQSYYDISDQRYLHWPVPPYPLEAWAEFQYAGVPVRVARVVQSSKRVSGIGEVLEPLVVGPAVSLNISPRAGIVPLKAKTFELTATVHSNMKGAGKGTVKLDLPSAQSLRQLRLQAD